MHIHNCIIPRIVHGACVPAAQSVHVVAAVAREDFPEGHAVQKAEPTPPCIFPENMEQHRAGVGRDAYVRLSMSHFTF